MSEKNKNQMKIIKIFLITLIAVPVIIIHLYIWFFIAGSYALRDSMTKKNIEIPYPDDLMRSLKYNRIFNVSESDTSDSKVTEEVEDSVLKRMIEETTTRRDLIVYFEAEGCEPCKKAYPAFKKYAKKRQGDYVFAMHYTLCDENGMWKNDFPVKIAGYPTLVHYKEGKEIINVFGTFEIADYLLKL